MSWFSKKEDEEESKEEVLRAKAIFILEFMSRVVGSKFHPESLTSFYLDKEGNHLFSLEASMRLDDELAFAKEVLGSDLYKVIQEISDP